MDSTLSNLYRIKAGLAYSRKQLSEQIEQQKILLTYAGELTGKDAEARKREYALAQEKVFLADEPLQVNIAALANLDFQIAQNQGEIEALEAERRDYEWDIRRALVEALGGKVIFRNNLNYEPGSDPHAFDDTMLAEADKAVIGNMADVVLDDSIPF